MMVRAICRGAPGGTVADIRNKRFRAGIYPFSGHRSFHVVSLSSDRVNLNVEVRAASVRDPEA